jgi:hypothetical protein
MPSGVSNHPAHMHFESEGNAVFLGRGLNGEVFGRQGLIQSIALGKYIIREPLCLSWTHFPRRLQGFLQRDTGMVALAMKS